MKVSGLLKAVFVGACCLAIFMVNVQAECVSKRNFVIKADAKAGDIIRFCEGPYIKILKQLSSNTFSIQAFYAETNQKITDPFIMKNNVPDGPMTEWYPNGKKRHEEFYKEGELHGVRIYWAENGYKSQEYYKNGKLDGIRTDWGANGRKNLEIHYLNGKKKWT